jgi:hypothetical protein
VDLPSPLLSRLSESRTGGVAVSSALLAVPALVGGHVHAGAVLLAVSAVAAAVFLERRTQASAGVRELRVTRLAVVPSTSVARRPLAVPRAHWEMVERDGRHCLSMRWR